MVGTRTATAIVGILASLAVSAVLYLYTGSVLFFLLVPFVPLLFRRGREDDRAERDSAPPVRKCPQCGFRTSDPEFEYCPRDGRRLDVPRTR